MQYQTWWSHLVSQKKSVGFLETYDMTELKLVMRIMFRKQEESFFE